MSITIQPHLSCTAEIPIAPAPSDSCSTSSSDRRITALSATASHFLKSAASAAGVQDRKLALAAALAPRPLYQEERRAGAEHGCIVAPTGERLLALPPDLNTRAVPAEPEPLGPRNKTVLPSGERDHSVYSALVAAHRAADQARSGGGGGDVEGRGGGEVVYERAAVLRGWAVEPWYAPRDGGDDTLVFESRFESGNLRRAVRVGPSEYDLELSPDFNTRGHTQWYFFAIEVTRIPA
jgi:hypothetical protein